MSTVIDVELKNFRCFSDDSPAQFRLQPGFTSFLGKNNSGKSTLLHFLYEFRDLFAKLSNIHELSSAVGGRISFALPASVPNPGPLFCDRNTRDLRIGVSFRNPAWRAAAIPKYVNVTIPRDQNAFHVELIMPSGRRTNGTEVRGVRDNNSLIIADEAINFEHLREAFSTLSSTMYLGAYRNALNIGTKENYYDIGVGQSFIQQWKFQQTGNVKVFRDRTYLLTESIKRIFGFDNLQINASDDNRALHVYVNGNSYDLSEMGSGLSQFILVLANVAFRQPAYILIDEPETGLHASLQQDFLTTLASYASVGVIYATHSIASLERQVTRSTR